MEELTEVITAAEFHPIQCNQFMYSSSKGTIKLADMRERALCDQHAKCKHLRIDHRGVRANDQCSRKKRIQLRNHSFPKSSRPSPTSSSPKTANTSYRETTLHSRFGMSLWRTNQSRRSISTNISVRSCATCTRMIASLTSLNVLSVEPESTSISPAKGTMLISSSVLTGSYHNYFRIYDVQGDNDIVLQADKSAFKAKKIGGARGKVPGKKDGLQTDNIDFTKKIVSPPFHR